MIGRLGTTGEKDSQRHIRVNQIGLADLEVVSAVPERRHHVEGIGRVIVVVRLPEQGADAKMDLPGPVQNRTEQVRQRTQIGSRLQSTAVLLPESGECRSHGILQCGNPGRRAVALILLQGLVDAVDRRP